LVNPALDAQVCIGTAVLVCSALFSRLKPQMFTSQGVDV